MDKLINITKLCKILKLIEPKTQKPLNHTIRYWEKEFPQIKPRKIRGRRYYSKNDVELIKFIKLLIKNQKMSILGVKNILKNRKKLDDNNTDSLINSHKLNYLRKKSNNLLESIRKIKNYGKKNSS